MAAPVLLKRTTVPTPVHFDRDIDVVVIGDAFVDIVAPVAAMPKWGQDLEAHSISQMSGGSALNVAVDLGELMKGRESAQCSFFGLVGDDEFGGFLRRRLHACGVQDRMETAAGTSTGCCIVLSGSHDRGFVTSVGATGLLSTEHLEGLDGSETSGFAKRLHIHVSGYFSCPSLQSGLVGLLRDVRSRASARGQHITISFDTNCDATGQWASGVVEVLREVDVFLPNEVEATGIAQAMGDVSDDAPQLESTGLLSLDALNAMTGAAEHGADTDERAALKRAADKLAKGLRCAVVVTCGKDGSILQTKEAARSRKAPRCFGAPRGIQPVDATGAGDAFDAGFIFRWAVCGGTLEEALRAGSCCGALCTESVGATASPASALMLAQMEAIQRSAVVEMP
jgi:ribokinase